MIIRKYMTQGLGDGLKIVHVYSEIKIMSKPCNHLWLFVEPCLV